MLTSRNNLSGGGTAWDVTLIGIRGKEGNQTAHSLSRGENECFPEKQPNNLSRRIRTAYKKQVIPILGVDLHPVLGALITN